MTWIDKPNTWIDKSCDNCGVNLTELDCYFGELNTIEYELCMKCMQEKIKMEQNEIKLEERNSVEISVNAKGLYSGKVKVYKENIKDAHEAAVYWARELESLIKEKNN